MAETITATAAKLPTGSSLVKPAKNGAKTTKASKPDPKKVKEVVKKVEAARKAIPVSKLTKEQKEYYDTLTKAEKEYYLAHNATLRGMPTALRPKWEPEKKMTSAAELQEAGKSPLRKPQARILKVLCKAKNGLTRKEIFPLANCEEAWGRNWLGQPDKAARLEREERWGFTSLYTLGYVTSNPVEFEGRTVEVYTATAKGKQAMEKYEKENGKVELGKKE